jgi:hypothetical protein
MGLIFGRSWHKNKSLIGTLGTYLRRRPITKPETYYSLTNIVKCYRKLVHLVS